MSPEYVRSHELHTIETRKVINPRSKDKAFGSFTLGCTCIRIATTNRQDIFI